MLSILDLAILGVSGSALAIALVLVRRPRLRARIGRLLGPISTQSR